MVESASATVLLPSRNIQSNSSEVSMPLANTLHLARGDYITIHGKRFTASAVEEIVKGEGYFIRPDGYTRQSAGATLNATVEVGKIEKLIEGSRVVLTSEEGADSLDGDEVKAMLLGRLVAKGQLVASSFDGNTCDNGKVGTYHEIVFTVVDTKPSSVVKISKVTQVIVSKDADVPSTEVVGYDRIGGLDETIEKLRIYVSASLANTDLFNQLGIPQYRGILLRGPNGTGKTLIINLLLQETGAYRVTITPDRLLRDGFPQACTRLREKFAEAKEHSPAIIAFEKIDRICRKSEGYGSPELDQLATTLANEFDSLGEKDVIVLASANNREAIDPILLTAGRFDKEIVFDPPNEEGRREILRILTRNIPQDTDVDLRLIAERTHGFTGADLGILCSDALYESIMRQPGSLRPTGELRERLRTSLHISMRDFTEALKTRKASCGRAYIRETAKVAWNEIGGLDELKSELAREVIAPIRYRQIASKLGVRPPTGILLYGPPGTGKTHLAKAISTQLGWPIISKRGAELTSKYLGETQKNIDDLFQAALANAPATIHLDEIDSLAPKRIAGGDSASQERSSAVNTLLESIDKITDSRSQILLIFTTNRKDILDDAFLRSGRVEGDYYVGPPDEKGREAVFRIYARNYQTEEIDYKELARNTEGSTPADIKWIWEEASRIRFATSILNHESLPESTHFLKDLLEGESPKGAPQPQTNIKTDPVTMQDLFVAIEKLLSRSVKRRPQRDETLPTQGNERYRCGGHETCG